MEPVNPAGAVRKAAALFGNFSSRLLDIILRGERFQLFLHAGQTGVPQRSLVFRLLGPRASRHPFRRIPPVPLDHRRQQQPRCQPHIEKQILGLCRLILHHCLDLFHDRSHFLAGRPEQPVQFLPWGQVRFHVPHGFVIFTVAGREPVQKPGPMIFVYAVKQPVVRADGIGHQFAGDVVKGIRMRAVVFLQQKTNARECMDHRAAADRIAPRSTLQVIVISHCEFPRIMQPAGQIRRLFQTKNAQTRCSIFRGPPGMLLHRLAAQAVLRNVGVIFHPACSLLSKNKSQPWIKKSQS